MFELFVRDMRWLGSKIRDGFVFLIDKLGSKEYWEEDWKKHSEWLDNGGMEYIEQRERMRDHQRSLDQRRPDGFYGYFYS